MSNIGSDFPDYEIRDDEYDRSSIVSDNWYFFYILPFLTPLMGFTFFDPLSSFFHDVFINLGPKTWAAVDGGQYKAEILAPTVNGIVLPTISISLATLVAGTISALRDRQAQIRSCLNKEACTIRTLHSTLLHLSRTTSPKHRQNILSLLYRYNSRIIAESRPMDTLNSLTASDSELQTMFRYLYLMEAESAAAPGQQPEWSGGGAGTSESYAVGIDGGVLAAIQGLIADLNATRSFRLTVLQNEFPFIHWAVIALLGFSILTCFMIETDQDTLKFLDDTQLRIIFAFLMGSVSSTALLCLDLSQPFKFGFFSIDSCVEQLYSIRNEIEQDLLLDVQSLFDSKDAVSSSVTTTTSSSSSSSGISRISSSSNIAKGTAIAASITEGNTDNTITTTTESGIILSVKPKDEV